MKYLLIVALLLLSSFGQAQNVGAMQNLPNVFTAANTFSSTVTFSTLANGCLFVSTGLVGSQACYSLPTQYGKLRCESGLGDGLNAIAAGTYLQSFCYNDSGVTWTITGIKCYVDGGSSSTLNASGNTLGSLLTGAIACGTGFVAGTQTANVALTSGDYIKFTFVADGTAKQTTFVVSFTQ